MSREVEKKDQAAMKYFGTAFVCVPRNVMNRMYVSDAAERSLAYLHHLLFVNCYYAPGIARIGSRTVPCTTGEYVGSYSELAGMMHVSRQKVRHLSDKLVDRGLIERTKIKCGLRFHICGYEQFMDSVKNIQPSPAGGAARSTTVRPQKPLTPAQELAALEERLNVRQMPKDFKFEN